MNVLFLLLAFVAAAHSKRIFHSDQVMRLYPTEAQKAVVEQLSERYPVDFWSPPSGIRPVDVHVPKSYVAVVKVFLTRQRINYEVFIEDVQATIDASIKRSPSAQPKNGFNYDIYHTFEEIETWIEVMSENPLVTRHEYGNSFEGRPLLALQLSSGGLSRPAFVIDCGLHAREWISPASCMYAVKWILEDQQILQNIDIYVIPVSNPDGYVHTHEVDRLWRKTRKPNADSNCIGVDPNRNWDIAWSQKGSSWNPCDDVYHGPAAFSEVEVDSQAQFVLGIRNLRAYIDIHAYGQFWMYPYGYINGAPVSDMIKLDEIGQDSIRAIWAVDNKLFQQGPISQMFYVASGSSADYFYDRGISCSFAAELRDEGQNGFLLPESQIFSGSRESFAGLMVIANAIVDGKCS